MKAVIHPPVHESYQRHRGQRTWQIILPVVLAAIVFVALIVLVILAASRGTGDVARWAEVSTILISIPIIIVGFLVLLLLAGFVYLKIRLLQIAPIYTGKAQDFVYKISGAVKRAADAAVKPVFYLSGVGATIKALLGRKE
ncbi:MAG TPA: hypothetical protein VFZ43_09735 [Anaerolineales bacterium]